jgi:tetratricopeptide (TPR) repeat protein
VHGIVAGRTRGVLAAAAAAAAVAGCVLLLRPEIQPPIDSRRSLDTAHASASAAGEALRASPRPAGPSGTPFADAFERGIAAYNADDTEAALDAFEEAVRLNPDDPEAHINLGLVYMRLQRTEDALRELTAGVAIERRRDGLAAEPSRRHGRGGTIQPHANPGRGAGAP